MQLVFVCFRHVRWRPSQLIVGSPVTHIFEVVSGKDWTVHGVCGYASFSTYQHESDEQTNVCWKEAIVINNSTHKLDENSAEYKSGH